MPKVVWTRCAYFRLNYPDHRILTLFHGSELEGLDMLTLNGSDEWKKDEKDRP